MRKYLFEKAFSLNIFPSSHRTLFCRKEIKFFLLIPAFKIHKLVISFFFLFIERGMEFFASSALLYSVVIVFKEEERNGMIYGKCRARCLKNVCHGPESEKLLRGNLKKIKFQGLRSVKNSSLG